MTQAIRINVLGKPKAQSRPLVLKTGKVISDRSTDLRKWKDAIRKAAKGITLPPSVPLSVVIVIGMPVADKKLYGKLHSAQPDFDNLAKAIIDAMQADKRHKTLPIDNDGRISSSWILKIYSPKGFGRIIIECLDDREPESAFEALVCAWNMPGGVLEICQQVKKCAIGKK